MFTPQMKSEYSPLHFVKLEFQWYNEVYVLFKYDLHDSSSMLKLPKQKYDLDNYKGEQSKYLCSLFECANAMVLTVRIIIMMVGMMLMKTMIMYTVMKILVMTVIVKIIK